MGVKQFVDDFGTADLHVEIPSVAFPPYPDIRLAAPAYGRIARTVQEFQPPSRALRHRVHDWTTWPDSSSALWSCPGFFVPHRLQPLHRSLRCAKAAGRCHRLHRAVPRAGPPYVHTLGYGAR